MELTLEAPWKECVVKREPYFLEGTKNLLQLTVGCQWYQRPLTLTFNTEKTEMKPEEWRSLFRACKEDHVVEIQGDYQVRSWANKSGIANIGLKYEVRKLKVHGKAAELHDADFKSGKEYVPKPGADGELFVKAVALTNELNVQTSKVKNDVLRSQLESLKYLEVETPPATSETGSGSGSTSKFVQMVSGRQTVSGGSSNQESNSTPLEGMPAAPSVPTPVVPTAPKMPPPAAPLAKTQTPSKPKNNGNRLSGSYNPNEVGKNQKRTFSDVESDKASEGSSDSSNSSKMDMSA
ncbi:hypothetical protein BGZ68_001694 [Mortierella alpina]|nr:hypothetical protein BGZ68_001694 [Mortierella alpina]